MSLPLQVVIVNLMARGGWIHAMTVLFQQSHVTRKTTLNYASLREGVSRCLYIFLSRPVGVGLLWSG